MTTQATQKDPVCGMDVSPDSSWYSEFEGTTYFFCCGGCQSRFERDPEGVLAARGSADAKPAQQDHHACCGGGHDGGGKPTLAYNGASSAGAVYTCPMHPDVEQIGPGACPICGMDLEPKFVDLTDDSDTRQFREMLLRFWVGFSLSLPLLVLAMGPMLGLPLADSIPDRLSGWLQLVLATPVVFWCGWPLLVRGVTSFQTLNLNMFSLIAARSRQAC